MPDTPNYVAAPMSGGTKKIEYSAEIPDIGYTPSLKIYDPGTYKPADTRSNPSVTAVVGGDYLSVYSWGDIEAYLDRIDDE